MTTLNDYKLSGLAGLGFTQGDVGDRELAWLISEGASAGSTIGDAYLQVLAGLGYTTGTWNDRLYKYLQDQGYVGTYNDALLQWWVDGGGFGPAAATFVPASSGIDTAGTKCVIAFNKAVSGTGELGFTVRINGSPATIAAFGPVVGQTSWSLTLTSPQVKAGDTATVEYNATVGDLVTDDGGADVESFAATAVPNNSAFVDPPTLVSANIDTFGTKLTAVFSKDMTGNPNLGFSLTANGSGEVVVAGVIAGDTITWDTSDIYSGETVLLSYDAGTGNMGSTDGGVLASFTDSAVTNDSTQNPPQSVFQSAEVQADGLSTVVTYSSAVYGDPTPYGGAVSFTMEVDTAPFPVTVEITDTAQVILHHAEIITGQTVTVSYDNTVGHLGTAPGPTKEFHFAKNASNVGQQFRNGAELDFANPLRIELTCKLDNDAPPSIIYSACDDSGQHFEVRFQSNNTLRVEWGGSSSTYSINYVLGDWYLIDLDGLTPGACVATVTALAGPTAPQSDTRSGGTNSGGLIAVGGQAHNNNPWQGVVREIKVYGPGDVLIHRYEINDDGDTLVDSVGGANMTLNGSSSDAGEWRWVTDPSVPLIGEIASLTDEPVTNNSVAAAYVTNVEMLPSGTDLRVTVSQPVSSSVPLTGWSMWINGAQVGFDFGGSISGVTQYDIPMSSAVMVFEGDTVEVAYDGGSGTTTDSNGSNLAAYARAEALNSSAEVLIAGAVVSADGVTVTVNFNPDISANVGSVTTGWSVIAGVHIYPLASMSGGGVITLDNSALPWELIGAGVDELYVSYDGTGDVSVAGAPSSASETINVTNNSTQQDFEALRIMDTFETFSEATNPVGSDPGDVNMDTPYQALRESGVVNVLEQTVNGSLQNALELISGTPSTPRLLGVDNLVAPNASPLAGWSEFSSNSVWRTGFGFRGLNLDQYHSITNVRTGGDTYITYNNGNTQSNRVAGKFPSPWTSNLLTKARIVDDGQDMVACFRQAGHDAPMVLRYSTAQDASGTNVGPMSTGQGAEVAFVCNRWAVEGDGAVLIGVNPGAPNRRGFENDPGGSGLVYGDMRPFPTINGVNCIELTANSANGGCEMRFAGDVQVPGVTGIEADLDAEGFAFALVTFSWNGSIYAVNNPALGAYFEQQVGNWVNCKLRAL